MAFRRWTEEKRAELMAATNGLEGHALAEVLKARGMDRSYFYKIRDQYRGKARSRGKGTRHMWTDGEKRELMAATAGLEGSALQEALKKRGVNSTWFYRLRKEYSKSQAAPAPAVHLVNESFRDASRERKRELIEEFLTLTKEQKDEWCQAHGTNRALVYYHRARLEKKPTPRGRPRKDASEKALAVRAFLNGAESRPPQAYPLHPLPVAQVEGLTLHEAIVAMEVERDHMSEFIDKLKRMQRSAR
jgi:hypothetical protein